MFGIVHSLAISQFLSSNYSLLYNPIACDEGLGAIAICARTTMFIIIVTTGFRPRLNPVFLQNYLICSVNKIISGYDKCHYVC